MAKLDHSFRAKIRDYSLRAEIRDYSYEMLTINENDILLRVS